MRRADPRPLGAGLEEVLRSLAPSTPLAQAQGVWREAVGDRVAAAAEPVSESEGVLTVRCGAAVWAQELDLLSEDLLARLNATLEASGASWRASALRCVTGSGGGGA